MEKRRRRPGSIRAVSILFGLFGGGPAGCEDAEDADDSGAVLIGDAVYLLAYLFLDGLPTLDPYPAPGVDLSEDSLGRIAPGS